MNQELYHAGVRGMKWGVRNDDKTKKSGSKNGVITKTTVRKNTTTITARDGDQKAKLKIKKNRGAKLVAKNKSTKVKVMLANTANVATGALRVAGAFIPGMSVLTGVAQATALAGTLSSLK
jgi:hypothetical protein